MAVDLQVEVAVAGAGMAGSAVAWALAAHAPVVLLERETQPGWHSTGRSAAMLTETYGTATVRALATASRPFFETPPPGFAADALLTPRGMLHLAAPDQMDALDAAERFAADCGVPARRLDAAAVCALAPLLDPAAVGGGLLEPDAQAIDVAALHQGFLRGLKARGGQLLTGAEILGIEREGGGWRLLTRAGTIHARILVNAAGAWADELALLAGVPPVGLVPKRRTAILLDPPPGADPAAWPMVIDVEEQFYIKPESGLLLVSPADETPVAPCDAQPEELDVAIAVDRFERVTGRTVPRIVRRWAGLRSFVADHDPVVGPDPARPDFVWLAALGGFGIMTAPALGQLAAAAALGHHPPVGIGLDPARLGPARLR
jgi:D-arginine dehydrogenase